ELLDRAAVAGDQRPAGVEVAREQLAHVLGIARLRHGREAHEVGEEHRDEPALGERLGRLWPRRRRGAERGAALTAELGAGRVARAARRAHHRERSAALTAELASNLVLGSARMAAHAS